MTRTSQSARRRNRSPVDDFLVLFVVTCLLVSISGQDEVDSTTVVAPFEPAQVSTSTTTTTPSTSTSTTTTQAPVDTSTTSAPSKQSCPVAGCTCTEKRLTCQNFKLTKQPILKQVQSYTDITFKNVSLDSIDFRQFPAATLESLTLSYNKIRTISIAPSRKSQVEFPKLISLWLSGNRIESLENLPNLKMPALKELYLADNKIETLKPLSVMRLPALNKLDLSYNQIDSLKDLPKAELEQLNLSRNPLRKLRSEDFLNTKEIRELNLRATALQNIELDTFAPLSNLETLDLSDNPLVEVPAALRSTPAIKKLVLDGLQMTSLRPADFINRFQLEKLQINKCPNLTRIDEDTFAGLANLTSLTVSNNPNLKHISTDVFGSTAEAKMPEKLSKIDFSNNNISTMSDPTKWLGIAPQVVTITLGGNPWDCNCDQIWLLSFIKFSPLHCKTPQRYKDMEASHYFATTDCELENSDGYGKFVLALFLIFLLVLIVAVFAQKFDLLRRFQWRDQYGTIYYTKASFPTETV